MSNRSGGYNSHVNQNQAQPEIHIIKLHKSTNGMGLSIVAAKVRIIPKQTYIYSSRFYNKILLYINPYFFYFFNVQGAGQDRLGIYIKSVVAGGAADAVSNYSYKKIFIV